MRFFLLIYPNDNLDRDPRPIEIASGFHGSFRSHQVVSARLEEYSANFEYLLQVGADSDCRVQLRRGVRDGEFLTSKGDRVFRLFRSSWGNTNLYLFQIKVGESGQRTLEECVLCESVWIKPPSDIKSYYNNMLYDMRFVPSFFLDDFRGQMKLNGFLFNWEAGTTDEYDFQMELKELDAIVRRIEPLYEKVFAMPMASVVRVHRKMALGRARGLTPSDYRRLGKYLSKRENEINSRVHVFVSKRERSNNLPAHRAMLSFLVNLKHREGALRRLLSIHQDVLDSASETDKQVYSASMKDPAYIGKENERLTERYILAKCWDRGEHICSVLDRLLQNVFWDDVKEGVSAIDIYPTAFYASSAYERIYAEILLYEKKKFSTRAIRDGRDKVCKLSNISFKSTRDDTSRWQRKYSIVYEFWAYFRLHKAFLSAGYKIVKSESKSIDSGSYCSYLKGDLHVRIIHGIVARWKQYRQPDDCFWLEYVPGDGAKERTPDFVLIFTNVKTKRQDWIVLDAKSDEKMHYHIIEKRQKYYKKIKRYKQIGYDCPESPSQSWIIYSGEHEEKGVCRVECPPRHSVNLNPDEIDYDAGSTSYIFSEERGLELADGNHGTEIHGNLHVNIAGVGSENGPFETFVNGETKTMARKLGARLVY